MRIAYLIAAHDRPRQLEQLAAKLLSDSDSDIAIIHADRRSGLWKQRSELSLPPGAQLLADPVAVHWGHWSQLAATHKLIRSALAEGCDAAHLISGKDWPIASRDEVASELAKQRCHIEARPGYMADRMQTYRFDTRLLQVEGRAWPVRQFAWELRRIARFTDGLRDRFGRQRSQPYGPWAYGSSWWSLPRDVLEVVERELSLLLTSGRLRGTLCSDEHVIQTIVARSFADRLASNRRFILWPEGSSNPTTLGRQHLQQIETSNDWFARKCDREIDPFFLDIGATTARSVA